MKHLIIIGAPRCGTTLIYKILVQTGSFNTAYLKELNYFHQEDYYDPYSQKRYPLETNYSDNFDGNSCFTLEASPGYSNIKNASHIAKKISSTLENYHLIYMQRDKLEKFVSHYRSDLSRLGREISISEYLDSRDSLISNLRSNNLNTLQYTEVLNIYREICGSDNISILYLSPDISQTLRDLRSILLLNQFNVENFNQAAELIHDKVNPSRDPRSRLLSKLVHKFYFYFHSTFSKFPRLKKLLVNIFDLINTKSSNYHLSNHEIDLINNRLSKKC